MFEQKVFRTGLLLVIVTVLLSSCSSVAGAQSLYETILDRSLLVVGSSSDYPPFEYVKAGEVVGFDIALINEIAERLDVELMIEDGPYDRLPDLLVNEKIDLAAAAIHQNPELSGLEWSEPYFEVEDALISLEPFQQDFNFPEDLCLYDVIVLQDSHQAFWLQNPDTNLICHPKAVHFAEHYQSGFEMLESIPDSLFLTDLYPVTIILDSYLPDTDNLISVDTDHYLYIITREGEQTLLDKVNLILQDLQDEGFINNLADQYLGSSSQ